MIDKPLIFSGSTHTALARELCSKLKTKLGGIELGTFPDGEISVRILDDVQGKEIFVIQSIAHNPNHFLIELLIIIDALKRGGAKKISAIIPYFGYARQDRRDKKGSPITAKLIADMLMKAGISHLIAVDLHAEQIEGFFDIPVTHLRCSRLLANHFAKQAEIVVAPDLGSIRMGENISKEMGLPLAIIKKDRVDPSHVKTTLFGSVKGKNVLIVDDLCSTANTIAEASKLCKKEGALKIYAAITHGLFVQDAIKKIISSPIDSFLTTNTIERKGNIASRIKQISIAKMIAETIQNR